MAELRKYGASTTIDFVVVKQSNLTSDYATSSDWVPATGDVMVVVGTAAEANTTNLPTYIGARMWKLTLTAGEMTADHVRVFVHDATTPGEVIEQQVIVIDTYGNASAQHAFDLDTAAEAMRGTDSAALATVLGAAVNADISADIAAIPTTAMRGTDNAATATALATAQTDLDTITGTNGATLASSQPSYAPAKATDIVTGGAISTGGGLVQQVGSVGSVTNNVGGSVGSVVGAVGSVTGSVGSVVGHTPQTGDSYSRLGIPATGTIKGDIAANSPVTITGTADSGTTATLTDAALNQPDTDFWRGNLLRIISGSGSIVGQVRLITGFDPATDTITVDRAFTSAVAAGMNYDILDTGYLQDMRGTDSAATASTIGTPVGASISADIAAVDTKATDIQGATFDTATDSLEAIRNRGDSAWITGSSSGLTSQQTRDAMKLAPTAGAPGTGSIDEHLDNIPTTPMRGTDSAALASVLGAAVGASISADIAAIPTTPMRGTDGANTTTPQTSQQTRDAMKLAPTAGAPSAGSIDEHLDNIPTTPMRGTDSAALATVLGAAVGASISADIAAIPTTPMRGTDGANTTTPQTSQQTRDAMKLAPTAGAPSAGSVDEHLDNIPIVMRGTDSAALASTIGTPVGADISADIAAVDTKASDIQGATFDAATDSLEAIRNRGDAAWTTGAGGGSGLTSQQTRDAMKLAPTAGSPAAGSIDAHLDTIEASAGGGGSVILGPVVSVRDPSSKVGSPVPLEMFRKDAKTFSITLLDTSGAAVDLTAKTLRFVTIDSNSPANGVFDVEAAGITITGANNEIANVAVDANQSDIDDESYGWRLRDVTNGVTLAYGTLRVLPSVDNVL